MFAAAPCKATPDFSPAANPFILTKDFSKTAIGAVLSQEHNNVDRFLGVKGRTCRNSECNYYSSKGELLAHIYKLQKFDPLFRLNKFIVVTDYTAVLPRIPPEAIADLAEELSQFELSILDFLS